MSHWIDNIKLWVRRYVSLSLTSSNIDMVRELRKTRDKYLRKLGSLRRVGIRFWIWMRGVARKIDETPIIVKLQIALLTIILLFIFWQFMAYEMSQTTFICVNIIMAVGLTTATAVISVRSQRGVDDAQRTIDELKLDLQQRDTELDRLKTSLFELRNKNRRQNAIEKGSVRFVETVRKMKANSEPNIDESLQYLIDAIGVCFDITGAVAYERWDDIAPLPAEPKADADAPAEDGEAAEAPAEPAKFVIAGRFGLSDEPPTMVFLEEDGILGQAAVSDKPLTLEKVPAEYLTALSGLGRSRNINVYVLPLSSADGKVRAVVEVASFEKLKIVDAWESIEAQLRDVIQS